MADAEVVVVGPGELPIIADLYNKIFRPPRDVTFFRRRFQGRHNALMLLAHIDGRPVGFATGFELKPNTFFSWLIGVHPDYLRQGIATQIHEAEAAWAKVHGYQYIRMECHNAHRPILHLSIATGFNIVGIRWDPDRSENLIIFEKAIED
jgi:GNAT superfamily N-acetyltransferase